MYHAIYLNELDPVYIYPKFDTELGLSTEIDAEDVQKALEEHPKDPCGNDRITDL